MVRASGDASQQQVQQLIAALCYDQWLGEGFARSFMAERMSIVDTANALIEHRLDPATLTSMTSGKKQAAPEPLPSEALLLTAAGTILDHLTKVIKAAKLPRLTEYRSNVPDPAPTLHTSLMGTLQTPTFDRAAASHYGAVARVRLAAVALAVRCWMADHGGALPPSLDSLVPTHLTSIPQDPLSTSTPPAAILYRPTSRPSVASASIGLPARGAKAAGELTVPLLPPAH